MMQICLKLRILFQKRPQDIQFIIDESKNLSNNHKKYTKSKKSILKNICRKPFQSKQPNSVHHHTSSERNNNVGGGTRNEKVQ